MGLIDANALIRDGWILERHGVSNSLLEVKSIADVPTIEAEPVKHGRWKLHNDGSGTCDQCHFTQKNVWDFDNCQNYCGVCGAKMDLESE